VYTCICRPTCALCLQNISNIAWAFGKLGVHHPGLFDALASAAKGSNLEGYNNQNMTDLAWGFAQSGHKVRGAALHRACSTI
jgi:hypothetical protein